MLEVDVDVRRFVPLLRDEALEQQGDLLRRDLGDEQAVADHRVGRRAAALAQDVALPGEAHDVVDGEKVVLVFQLPDQRQFPVDALLYRPGNALRPAQLRTPGHQLPQVAVGIVARGHHLLGVLVAQLVQAELAQVGNAQRLFQQGRRVEALQLPQRAQVALAVAGPSPTQLLDAGVVPERAEHVVQGLACGGVHLHVAAGHQGQAGLPGQPAQGLVATHFVVAQQVADPQPYPPPAQAGQLQPVGPGGRVAIRGQPDQQAALEMKDHVPQTGPVLPLGAAPPGHTDQPRQLAVGGPRRRQGHQFYPLFQGEFTADDELEAQLPGRHVGLHRARQGALVGDGQRPVAQRRGLLHQLMGVGGAAQEAVTAQAVEFGVGHARCSILYIHTV